MRSIANFWSKYKLIVFIFGMICWFLLLVYVDFGKKNGKFGYELDNNEKEAMMMKQLPKLIQPYKFNEENVIKRKRGPTSKIYITFEFKSNDDKEIKKFLSVIDKNSTELGFKKGCRGKESIVYYSNNFYPDPTVTEMPPEQYTIEWEYPNPICVKKLKIN
jgi:hypothetical protein